MGLFPKKKNPIHKIMKVMGLKKRKHIGDDDSTKRISYDENGDAGKKKKKRGISSRSSSKKLTKDASSASTSQVTVEEAPEEPPEPDPPPAPTPCQVYRLNKDADACLDLPAGWCKSVCEDRLFYFSVDGKTSWYVPEGEPKGTAEAACTCGVLMLAHKACKEFAHEGDTSGSARHAREVLVGVSGWV